MTEPCKPVSVQFAFVFGALVSMFAACGLAISGWAQAAPPVYAIRGGKVYTLAGPPLENATVVIREGKIAAVGHRVEVPAGAQIIDAKGLEVYPGFFNPVTQIGLTEISQVNATNDVAEVGAYNPELVAATAVNPASAHIPVTRASGITHVVDTPGIGGLDLSGGASVISGQASAIHLSGWTINEMLVRRTVAMVVNWPTLQTRSFDPSTFAVRQRPFTEVKQEYDKKVNELTDWLERARHYAQAKEKGSPAKFERDLKLEALAPAVKGQLPVLVVADRAREIRNAIEFCDAQKVKMILAGGAEAYKVKDLLKAKSIPVILRTTQRLPSNEDASFDTSFARRLPYAAGNAAAYGLAHDEALKSVTLNPAQIFGLADQFGTIEPGKIANLIVTTGDPLELQTDVRYLFIKGQLTSTDNKHRQLYEEYRKRP